MSSSMPGTGQPQRADQVEDLVVAAEDRLPVAQSYQLYLGGSFSSSESGRVYPVSDHRGTFLANAAQASRKDARDAVAAARAATGWACATAEGRGQTSHGRKLSSGFLLIFLGCGPGGGLVVGGAVPQAAMEDADEAVGQPSESVVVADVAVPEAVVIGACAW